jgi:hypothetical protein
VPLVSIVDLTNVLVLRKSCILSQPKYSRIKPSLKGSWPWSLARMPRRPGTTLRSHSRTSIGRARGLLQDLYTASKGNQAFLHARFGLGNDQLQPFKASISRWISPDLMKGQSISVAKAKKAIADCKKAIGRPDGMAELSTFYCEEAISFLESCSMDDEKYFAALIRMYGRSLEIVSSLPLAERSTYLERLGRLRSRGRNVGWVVEEEFNSLWYDAVDEQHSE